MEEPRRGGTQTMNAHSRPLSSRGDGTERSRDDGFAGWNKNARTKTKARGAGTSSRHDDRGGGGGVAAATKSMRRAGTAQDVVPAVGATSDADSAFEERLRRKLAEDSASGGVSSVSRTADEYEKKMRRKMEREDRSSSMLEPSKSIRPKNPLSRMTATGVESASEERSRRKLSGGDGATAKTMGYRPARITNIPLPRAYATDSAFEERLKRKLSEEDRGTEKTMVLPPASFAIAATAEEYDEKMRRKVETENHSVSIPPSPESDRPANNLALSVAASSGADHAIEEGQRRELAGDNRKEKVVGRGHSSRLPVSSAGKSSHEHEGMARRSNESMFNLTLDQKIEAKKQSNKIKFKGKGRSSNAYSFLSKERQRPSKEEVAAKLHQKRMSRLAVRGSTLNIGAGDDVDRATVLAASSVSGRSRDDDGEWASKREAVAAELYQKRMQRLRRFARGTTVEPIDAGEEGNEEDLSTRSRGLGGIKTRISSCGDIRRPASWECGNCAYVNKPVGSSPLTLCKICQKPNPDFSGQEGQTKEAPSNRNESFPTITAKDDINISSRKLGGAIATASAVSASEKKRITLTDVKTDLHTSWSELDFAIALATERSVKQEN